MGFLSFIALIRTLSYPEARPVGGGILNDSFLNIPLQI